ncbi:hypothetical protein GYMLUDRAFT_503373 [Collybiopsis luxurians FD-317 M1]|uniref:BTB domain-containing protein n=1 Tax=Collybiopsis luxurians FD-317 M1 TaxID=944289 RepID=A0A0D0CT32_9AGAR|nr:hypothetical protein GYMLUDRAFT_503373 [Collybiopsis luxurians FD-317 M1]
MLVGWYCTLREPGGLNVPFVATTLKMLKEADIVVIQSSDMVEFPISKSNLEYFTEGFPPAETSTKPGEVVSLTETSQTLRLLCAFVDRKPPPTLDDIDIDDLFLLAKAAEKYVVYNAITICRLKLSEHFSREFLSKNPKEILGFAAEYHYTDVITALYPILMDTPLTEIAAILPSTSRYFAHWSLQSFRWTDALVTAIRLGNDHNCQWWGNYVLQILRRLDKPSCLTQPHLRSIFRENVPNWQHTCCFAESSRWEQNINQLVNKIPKFSISIPKERDQADVQI